MPKHQTRPNTLEEIFANDAADATAPQDHPALAAWEEVQRVEAGMPDGDLKTRVSYLKQQRQLDPANQARLIRQQVAQDAQNTPAPAWRKQKYRQGNPELDQLTANVTYLADHPDYAGQDSNTMLRQLGSGWNPNPLPASPAPPLSPWQSTRDGALNAYHTARGNLYDTSAAFQGLRGYPASAQIQHDKATRQRRQANTHPAPPDNARLADKALWQTANTATNTVPWLLGGLPLSGARTATRAAVLGGAKLTQHAYGALPTMVETTGNTYNDLINQGFHPEQAAELAVGAGAGVAAAGQFAPQFSAGPSQSLGEQLATEGVNQGMQELAEDIMLKNRQNF